MTMKVSAFLNLAVSLLWLGFIGYVIYDLHDHNAKMEAMGRDCAKLYGEPYRGKTCVQLLAESNRKASR
jgi:hypothetical protein